MITGMDDSARIVRHTSRPSPSGSARSSSTRSGLRSRARRSASVAVPATIASKPSRRRSLANGSAIEHLVLDEQDPGPRDRHRGERTGAARASSQALPKLCLSLPGGWTRGAEGVGMSFSRTQVAVAVTLLALGALAAAALASRPEQTSSTSAAEMTAEPEVRTETVRTDQHRRRHHALRWRRRRVRRRPAPPALAAAPARPAPAPAARPAAPRRPDRAP